MKKKILFIKKGATKFEENDVVILSKYYDVTVFEPSYNNLFTGLKLIINCDLLYYWFPNDYKFIFTLLAKILNKKVFIIAGGQMSLADTRKSRAFAKVKYRPLHIICGILCLKLANKVVAVSKYEREGLSRYLSSSKITVIYNSINQNYSYNKEIKRDSNLIITISAIINTHYYRKGLDVFVNLSKKMPDYTFVLIGKDCRDGTFEMIKNNSNKNLILTDSVSDNELKNWISRAKIYCQFSRQEGFGVALAEAIGAGCLPIISKFGAIPEVVGSYGFYVDDILDIQNIKKITKVALKSNYNIDEASKRIHKLFNDVNRESIIIHEVSNLLKEN